MTNFNADKSIFVPSSLHGKVLYRLAERMFNAEIVRLSMDELTSQFYDLSKIVAGKHLAVTKPQLSATIAMLVDEAEAEGKVPVLTVHKGKTGGVYLGYGPGHNKVNKEDAVLKLANKGEGKIGALLLNALSKCFYAERMVKASEAISSGRVNVEDFQGANPPWEEFEVESVEFLESQIAKLKALTNYELKKANMAKRANGAVIAQLPAAQLEIVEVEGESLEEDSSPEVSSEPSEDDERI
jgi:hypothetical protein